MYKERIFITRQILKYGTSGSDPEFGVIFKPKRILQLPLLEASPILVKTSTMVPSGFWIHDISRKHVICFLAKPVTTSVE